MKKLIIILSALLFSNQAFARCAEEHMDEGWEPIQEGSIYIRDCGAEWPIRSDGTLREK
tara:strand:- start:179 stop:355 length:177 start_codon:yes stop_codon:yes gene_type:complete